MLKSPPKDTQNSQREDPARDFQSFKQAMKVYLSKMNPSEREALLKDLYHLADDKRGAESFLARERKQANSAPLFRKYRLWLVDVENALSKAKQALLEVPTFDRDKVKREKIDLDENYARSEQVETVVVRETQNAIAHAVTEVENVIADVKLAQDSLAPRVVSGFPPRHRMTIPRYSPAVTLNPRSRFSTRAVPLCRLPPMAAFGKFPGRSRRPADFLRARAVSPSETRVAGLQICARSEASSIHLRACRGLL